MSISATLGVKVAKEVGLKAHPKDGVKEDVNPAVVVQAVSMAVIANGVVAIALGQGTMEAIVKTVRKQLIIGYTY